MVAYIAMYYNCDTACLEQIGNIVKKYGLTVSKDVYRGQSKQDTTIDTRKPFVSTSPSKEMAEQFVERDWSLPEGKQKVGNLFTIHLRGAKWLSTRSIRFTLSDDVKEELRTIVGNKPIQKEKDYTLDEFFPRIRPLLKELLDEGEEILVLTGSFYTDKSKTTEGFKTTAPNEFEAWQGRRRKTRKHKRRSKKTRRPKPSSRYNAW